MGGPRVAALLVLTAILASACGERQGDAPTAPEFAPRGVSCNFTTVGQLVKNEFGANSAQSSLATDMKNAGAQTDQGTYDGYQILSAIATKYDGSQTSTTNASALAVALLGCMKVGTSAIPAATVFDSALAITGAFAIRGLVNPDNKPVSSHDGAWVLEPPHGATDFNSWQSILGDGLGVSTDPRIQYAFLAFGRPLGSNGFTNDQPISGVFDWSTLPSATFTGTGAVVGECANQPNYLQHLAATTTGVEVLGFVDPHCPSGLVLSREAAPRTLADRLFRLFSPSPAYAALLTTTGSGGSKRTLSPFQVIFPGNVVLDALFSWSKSGNVVNQPFSPPPTYQIRSTALTKFEQPKVLLWITASGNQGTNVAVCNNWAYTGKDGIAAFTTSFVNKSGGYTFTTHSAGAITNNPAGVELPTVPAGTPVLSPLVNVKSSVGTLSCTAGTNQGTFVPTFDAGGNLTNPPAFPGPNPAPNP